MFGQSAVEADKEQIKRLIVQSFDEIWSELNAKNIDKYYTKDFLLLEHGEIWNNDTIAKYLNNAKLRMANLTRVNTIEIIDIKVGKGTAWVAYQNYATFSTEGKITRKAHWLESATAVLTENGWKLDMLHSTRVPDN
jgi:hypothetical protein